MPKTNNNRPPVQPAPTTKPVLRQVPPTVTRSGPPKK
jgi:hypothetical protein